MRSVLQSTPMNTPRVRGSAYEELYWAFGGYLLSLTGILVVVASLLWRGKSIDSDIK